MNRILFDACSYFTDLFEHNKKCTDNDFYVGILDTGTNGSYISQLLKRHRRLILVDDGIGTKGTGTDYGYTQSLKRNPKITRTDEGTYYFQTYSISIINTYRYDDIEDWHEAQKMCLDIVAELCSHIYNLTDNDDKALQALSQCAVECTELNWEYGSGVTGIVAHMTHQCPIDITYNSSDWTYKTTDSDEKQQG